jgi:DNA-binding beta-propeller fold protein YncE
MKSLSLAFAAALAVCAGLPPASAQTIDLPTSKQLIGAAPGHPQRLNSLPISMAVSPHGRYIVTVNAGYGTYESRYEQSLAVLDTQTGALADFPDARTSSRLHETLYSGLTFSPGGKHIYASMASVNRPQGDEQGDPGNGIAVYSFSAGSIAPERFISIPLQQLAPGRTTQIIGGKPGDKAIPYPAAIAVLGSGSHEKLLVADNLADNVLLIDAASGKIEKTFDLSESDAVPATYPIALAVDKDGKRAFVALWNASQVAELNLKSGKVAGKLDLLKPSNPVAAGTHPSAFAFSPDGATLYVALSNRDAVAALDVRGRHFAVRGYFDTRLPGQSYFGAEPVALAVNAGGTRVYAANLGSDAVAVLDPARLTPSAAKKAMIEPDGFIPTEWMPLSMAFTGGKLYLATGKGKGTGPNDFAQPIVPGRPPRRGNTYIATLLYGSLASIQEPAIDANLAQWTGLVIASNRMKAAQQTIAFAGGRPDPIRHIVYIIKENRTYDQILGDLEQNGKPVGNGDAGLAMYGEAVTPNEHKLALQFGVLDNFFDSGEVSGDGHVWSNAAIGTDYLEKNWQINYRNGERPYDFEGVVADGYPLKQDIPDVNQPASGYLWGNLAAHGKTYYHFGEFVSSTFCDQKAVIDPKLGPMLAGPQCAQKAVAPGQTLPAAWGGGVNKWPWAIPLLAADTATKPELVGHFAPEAPDFNLAVPDQIRVNVFLRHFQGWLADLNQGRDTMPNFINLRLPDDHTAGTRPGGPSPKSSVADNDLAVGRVVEAISQSPFWDSTAIFVLEDDAQNGADHVDAHRSVALVISKYAPHAPSGGAFIDSRFYSTVSVVRTMESLLGLPPMNNNDAFAPPIASLFTGPGDQPAYTADTTNRDNALIYTANKKNAVGARASMKMDFTHADRAPVQQLNVILWKDAMGSQPVPGMLRAHVKQTKDDDDN